METWDLKTAHNDLDISFAENSEVKLLTVLKNNSFLFYELYSRKYGIRPNFCEVSFGGKYRCDFAWLNDNSDGPEWVLVEIEKPKMKLFTKKGEPTADLSHALEQVTSWQRYFRENPLEKKRIFGAVARFRYILVAGAIDDWNTDTARKWRIHHNDESNIEVRSSNIFYKALQLLKDREKEFWSFEDNPVSLKNSALETYWNECPYMDSWIKY